MLKRLWNDQIFNSLLSLGQALVLLLHLLMGTAAAGGWGWVVEIVNAWPCHVRVDAFIHFSLCFLRMIEYVTSVSWLLTVFDWQCSIVEYSVSHFGFTKGYTETTVETTGVDDDCCTTDIYWVRAPGRPVHWQVQTAAAHHGSICVCTLMKACEYFSTPSKHRC